MLFRSLKPRARARVEPPQVQILVVVANIQTRTLKAEVEKGSMILSYMLQPSLYNVGFTILTFLNIEF